MIISTATAKKMNASTITTDLRRERQQQERDDVVQFSDGYILLIRNPSKAIPSHASTRWENSQKTTMTNEN